MPRSHRRPQPSPTATLGGSLLMLGAAALGAMCAGAEVTALLVQDPAALTVAVVLATATTVPYTAALLWLDRNEKEPPWLLLAAFMWGAVAATAFSGAANTLATLAWNELLHDELLARQVTASLVAPVIEESAKAVALVALFTLFRDDADNVLDGLVYGALVGMGFAWFENVTYYVRAGAEGGLGAMVELAWVRGVLSGIGTHATFTALAGVGFGLLRVLRRGALRWCAPPAALALATFAHFVWNTFAGAVIGSTGDGVAQLVLGVPAAVVLLQLPFVLLLLAVLLASWSHEDHLIRRFLAEEPLDVAHPSEIERLVPARHRVRRGLAVLLSAGPLAWHRHRRLTHMLIRLAFERWHHHADGHPWAADRDATVLGLRARIRALRARGVRV